MARLEFTEEEKEIINRQCRRCKFWNEAVGCTYTYKGQLQGWQPIDNCIVSEPIESK